MHIDIFIFDRMFGCISLSNYMYFSEYVNISSMKRERSILVMQIPRRFGEDQLLQKLFKETTRKRGEKCGKLYSVKGKHQEKIKYF